MLKRPINVDSMSPATIAMFDYLADGRTRTQREIIDVTSPIIETTETDAAVGNGRRIRAKAGATTNADEAVLLESGAKDIARNRLMIAVRSRRLVRGADKLHAISADFAVAWATLRDLPEPGHIEIPPPAIKNQAKTTKTSTKQFRPAPIFAGMSEPDGFQAAPLQTFDRVHFRTNLPIAFADFRGDLPAGWSATADDSTGLYRVDSTKPGQGKQMAAWVETWCRKNGLITEGLKAQMGIRRRAHNDLPPGFLTDLCEHYYGYSVSRLKRNMTSIRCHIPDPEDVKQQIYEWILDAVARYDDTIGVPFGAYLATSLHRWVHDLSRRPFGRTAADAELAQARAVGTFVAENGRRPTDVEMAGMLGQSLDFYRTKRLQVANMAGLRNIGSLDTPETTIEIPDTCPADAGLLGATDNSLITLALTKACSADLADLADQAGPGPGVPDILGWVATVSATWDDQNPDDLARTFDMETAEVADRMGRVAAAMAPQLAGALG